VGTVTVTFSGVNLDPNTQAKLTKTGEADIIPQSVTGSTDGTRLTATFDLTGKTPGIWNFVVTNSIGQSTTLQNAFTIESGGEPATGELADFLPPNTDDIDPRGKGSVSYNVKPKSNLPTGTVIKNKATIDFEVGVPPDPMDTPGVFNTIDSVAPSSSVSPLAAIQNNTSFTVNWSGNDDAGGSGIKNYDIYVCDNGGPYTLWMTTSETSLTFAAVRSPVVSLFLLCSLILRST